MTRIAAIVPSRDRPRELRACLATLVRQRIGSGGLEVVVVDDGSRQPLSPAVEEAASGGTIPVRAVRTEPAGLNAARMAGVASTEGEIVAFLDDDVLLDEGWAGAVARAFAAERCAGLGGRVTLSFAGREPRWIEAQRSLLGELDLGAEPRWLDGDRLPIGANCAVLRSELERVGGFRAGLDRVGASLTSNGDTELFRRLRDAGGRLRYVPAAHAVHRVPPERLTLGYLRRRARAQGRSDVLVESIAAGRWGAGRRLREAARLGRTAPILVKGLARGDGSASARLWVEYCRGRLEAREGG